MSREDELKERIKIHIRRLNRLKMQQAYFGVGVDPSITMEIEDIEATVRDLFAELEQIERERQTRPASRRRQQETEPGPDSSSFRPWSDQAIEHPFGAMRPTSRFYIEREADDACWRYIAGSYPATIFIKASRQMGKSSLMLKMLDRAKKEVDKQGVFIDFQEFPKQYFTDTGEKDFLIEICLKIGDALGIEEAIDRSWQRRSSNTVKCGSYMAKHILPKVNAPLILAMDEVDRLSPSPFRDNFFGMLRVWHNRRAYDEQFAKMSLFLSSSTEASYLVENKDQSPFNVADYIFLQDFTRKEVEELNRRHHAPLSPDQVDALMTLIDGHPFLTRLALYQLTTGEISADALFSETIVEAEFFGEYLSHYLHHIFDGPEIKQMMLDICRHNAYPVNNYQLHRLEGAGLIKRVGRKVAPRNKLYARYFEDRLK